MTQDEFVLFVNSISKSSMVRLSDIRTDTDKRTLEKKGYGISFSFQEFKASFPRLPVNYIYFLPIVASGILYFNQNTYAVADLTVICVPDKQDREDIALDIIRQAEEDAQNGHFSRHLSSLPNLMAWELFSEIIQKKIHLYDTYSEFISLHQLFDYGFSGFPKDLLPDIVGKKTDLQHKQTEEKIASFPARIKVYRGGNSASTKFNQAISWTTDIRTANFFAVRLGNGPGYLVEGWVNKADILEYLTDRDENEVVVDPDRVEIVSEIKLEGLPYLKKALDRVQYMFLISKSRLQKVSFTTASEIHGRMHELRVLLLALLIADKLDLTLPQVDALATAAIYHDTCRTNDGEDTEHGLAARKYYEQRMTSPDPVVSFLCEYHCKPDKEGYEKLQKDPKLKKWANEISLLYKVFKDADALDRIRFGPRDLDVNKLRLPESKTLTIVARIVYEQLKW